MERLAACSASDSDSDPMMIMRPDLKTKIVLFGLVLRIITAGNRFLLQRLPSTFQAISFRSRSFSMFIFAKETTFCTKGRLGCSWIFSMPPKKINNKITISTPYKYFFQVQLLWVSNSISGKNGLFCHDRQTWLGQRSQKRQMRVLDAYFQLWNKFLMHRQAQKCEKVKLRRNLSAFDKQRVNISISKDGGSTLRRVLMPSGLTARDFSFYIRRFIYFQQSENRMWTREKKQAFVDKRAGVMISFLIYFLTIDRFPSLFFERKAPFGARWTVWTEINRPVPAAVIAPKRCSLSLLPPDQKQHVECGQVAKRKKLNLCSNLKQVNYVSAGEKLQWCVASRVTSKPTSASIWSYLGVFILLRLIID